MSIQITVNLLVVRPWLPTFHPLALSYHVWSRRKRKLKWQKEGPRSK